MKINLYNILVNFLIRNKEIKKMEHIPIDDVENILLMSNTAIGDTLFNTPVFRSLKRHYPDKKLIVLLNPSNYKLFETNQYIDDIVLYNGKWKDFFKTLKELKSKKIDLTFILHSNEPQATPLALLAHSKYIVKIPNDKNSYNKYHTNIPTKAIGYKHGIFDRLKQLEYVGIYEDDPKMDIFIEQEWIDELNYNLNKLKINKTDKLIGFQIGASTVSRMWFNDRWIALGKELLNKYPDIKIILTGAPNEKHLTNEVKKGINDERVIDLAGKLTLGGAATLIGKLNLLITPDTGPMHMAIALKTPTISLFVVAELIKSHACYDQDIHLYIKKDKTCDPCIAKRCKFQECMEQIDAKEVIELYSVLSNKIKEEKDIKC